MLKFRRVYKLINFTYSIFLVKPHVKKLTTGVNLSLIGENIMLKYPSYCNHQTHLMYSTGFNCSNNDTVFNDTAVDENDDECGGFSGDENEVVTGLSGLKDEKFDSEVGNILDIPECTNNENDDECGGFSDDEDEVVTGLSCLKDEKFDREVGNILDILRGRGCEGDENEGRTEVVSGVEVAKKLKQCGIIPTSEVVIEVLTRTRNDWEVAFMFFLWVGKQPGYTHSLREYHSMISILAKRRKFDTAWTLIDEMRKNGIVNRNTLLIMIRRYAATHDVTNAINTFHAFKRFDLRVEMDEFHKLLSALTRYKNVQEAEHLLFSNKNTFEFNTKSFNIILNGWCNVVGSPREGNRFWRLMNDHGIKLDVVSYSSIISSYSKFNKVKEVIKLFNTMMELGLEPDRKVYNAVMYALAKGGRAKEAFNHLRIMQDKGIAPDSVTFNSLIKPLCRARNRDEAQNVFDEMLRRGLRPNNRTFHAFLRIQRTEEEIFTLLEKMKELGCNPNKDTNLLLIKKFLRWQKLDKAFMFWYQMKENGWNDDSSSYIALIHGLFLNGKLEEAHKIYLEMKEKSLLPDAKTDELIQSWLSNKEMAESQIINTVPSLVDGDNASGMGTDLPSKRHKLKDHRNQPEFRKVVKERGFSFWE